MVTRNYRIEAKRWAKFPAVVLIITGILWLLRLIFNAGLGPVGSGVDNPLEFLVAMLNLIFPLMCIATAVCLLFLQRWSVWAAAVLPLFPLIVLTADKIQRGLAKYAEYRQAQLAAEQAGGQATELMQQASGAAYDVVMTGLLIVGLWGFYWLIIIQLRKTWYWLKRSQSWRKQRPSGRIEATPISRDTDPHDVEDGDYCFLMPEAPEDEPLDQPVD